MIKHHLGPQLGVQIMQVSTFSSVLIYRFHCTVEPVYYGHLGTNQRCPDYQGVLIFQVSLHDKAPFGTTARYPDYAGVHIFKCPDLQVPLYLLYAESCVCGRAYIGEVLIQIWLKSMQK